VHHLPLSRVKHAEFSKGLLSPRLVLKAYSREFFDTIPGSEDITLQLIINKAHTSEAESFTSALKLRHAEIVLRGQTEDPTRQ
jgi:hypothetical protein